MRKNIIKYLVMFALSASIFVAGFYLHIGYRLKKTVAEGTIGIAMFLAEEKKYAATVYNQDSIMSILESYGFSVLIEEFENNDTLHIMIFKKPKE